MMNPATGRLNVNVEESNIDLKLRNRWLGTSILLVAPKNLIQVQFKRRATYPYIRTPVLIIILHLAGTTKRQILNHIMRI